MLSRILPTTSDRVKLHTNENINDKIEEKTQENIKYYQTRKKEEITSRIKELDAEWDIERVLETNASIIILISAILSISRNKKSFTILTGIISGFLLQHALQGWCPPIPAFRRIGIRTSDEIDKEKYSLKSFIVNK